MEYRLILDTDIMSFHLIINEMISDNWIPQGGVSTVQTGLGTEFYQALVRIV
jgi:hypothetical protein